jgi:hypothetical protein
VKTLSRKEKVWFTWGHALLYICTRHDIDEGKVFTKIKFFKLNKPEENNERKVVELLRCISKRKSQIKKYGPNIYLPKDQL